MKMLILSQKVYSMISVQPVMTSFSSSSLPPTCNFLAADTTSCSSQNNSCDSSHHSTKEEEEKEEEEEEEKEKNADVSSHHFEDPRTQKAYERMLKLDERLATVCRKERDVKRQRKLLEEQMEREGMAQPSKVLVQAEKSGGIC